METESILLTIKKLLGITEEYTHFDTDAIVHINSAIMTLRQLGVGPTEGFSITGKEETWADYLGDDAKLIEGVKTYIYLKTKLVFDPPQSSIVLESIKEMISEYEFRLNHEYELYNVGDKPKSDEESEE